MHNTSLRVDATKILTRRELHAAVEDEAVGELFAAR